MAGDDYDSPMKSKGPVDRDIREDGVEHQLMQLDTFMSELIDTVSRLENRMMPYMRPESSMKSDPTAKAADGPMPRETGSEIGERIRSQREKVFRVTENLRVLMNRIDD